MTPYIIVAGPSGYAGAGRILCNQVEAILPTYPAAYVGSEVPFQWQIKYPQNLDLEKTSTRIKSGAIGVGKAARSHETLYLFELASEIRRVAIKASISGHLPVIWGHYIFPYGASAIMAANAVRRSGIDVRLMLTPTGSDIWEIGSQINHILDGLLSDDAIDVLTAYSNGFATEIASNYPAAKAISVLKPCINESFYPLSLLDRSSARSKIGIEDNRFVISFHSNMRPVKAPEVVVDVCRRVSALLAERAVSLIMAGPQIELRRAFSSLDIRQLGVIENMAPIVGLADVEINLSRHDSFNLSLAESMACGLPVVTTDVVGIAEDIEDSRSGMVVGLEDQDGTSVRKGYEKIQQELVKYGVDESYRAARGARASEYAGSAFSKGAFASRFCKLVKGPLALDL